MSSAPVGHRRVLVTPLALLLAGALGVSSLGAQQVEIGVRVGVTQSSMKWDSPGGSDGFSNEGRRGLTGGVSLVWPLSRYLAFQPEVMLVEKGFERTEPTYHPTYLEFPLLLRIGPTAPAPVRPFFLGGVAPALEVRCRVSYRTAGGRYSGPCDDPGPTRGVSTGTQPWDIGVVLGGGVALRAGPGSGIVDLRYTLGQRDLDTYADTRMLNRSLAASAGYTVPVRLF